ncbi:MAG: ABC transporter ATP-binding protein [Thermoleophilaceae bacterium]
MTDPSVSFKALTRRFDMGRGARRSRGGAADVVALERFDLDVRAGELVAVVGPSGCGKSTLLELAAGLQDPDHGTVTVAGERSPAGRRMACAFMPQRDLLLPWRDAAGNAALALECQGMRPTEARRRAEPLFERFGLANFQRARPAALSGGMRQRVAFMRTLLSGRGVLLLDEPFASLDSLTRGSMQEWLAEALAQEPRTTILVTHDVEEALVLADRVAVMSQRPGRIVAELEVGLERPRVRRELIADPRFTALAAQALGALGQ